MDLQETLGNLGAEVKKIPWWGWLAVGAVLLFLFWGKLPFGQSSSDQGNSATAPVSGDTSGGSTAGGSSDGGSTPSPTPSPTPTPTPAPTPKPTTTPSTTAKRSYTVKPGDTLSGIGAANGENWEDIYNRNASVIESTARQHGFSDSDHGHWIFPGETISL